MNALVLYDSQYGNTKRIAQAIAGELREFGEVRAIPLDPAHPVELKSLDLLVVGCPTQGWRPTPAIQSFLEETPSERLHGLAIATFDTRFKLPRWMTGSAAEMMAKKLQEKGSPAARAAGELLCERQGGPSEEWGVGSGSCVGSDASRRGEGA